MQSRRVIWLRASYLSSKTWMISSRRCRIMKRFSDLRLTRLCLLEVCSLLIHRRPGAYGSRTRLHGGSRRVGYTNLVCLHLGRTNLVGNCQYMSGSDEKHCTARWYETCRLSVVVLEFYPCNEQPELHRSTPEYLMYTRREIKPNFGFQYGLWEAGDIWDGSWSTFPARHRPTL